MLLFTERLLDFIIEQRLEQERAVEDERQRIALGVEGAFDNKKLWIASRVLVFMVTLNENSRSSRHIHDL